MLGIVGMKMNKSLQAICLSNIYMNLNYKKI